MFFGHSEPVNKKSKVEAKPKPSPRAGDSLDSSEALPVTPKKETSELDESIADITDDDKTSGGRQQRNRRKPKRWDDDEVEVDFSGQLGILAEQKQRQEEEDEIKERVVENNKNPENDDKKTKVFSDNFCGRLIRFVIIFFVSSSGKRFSIIIRRSRSG